ncbi:outer membrane protein [Bradyrhizobium yuanmingense]|uniref:outer membrane protein n=1 Tax=Bradyrhizobium yuanmingense TaxID=108015 RepID=UPI0023B9FFA7|nr:outer membrane beta-barrel protein [Bradyrhizobium yuanmingense]MDF0580288.1 outer membrane beta-barrel protein [Bradyrhizobium yuanmingense]
MKSIVSGTLLVSALCLSHAASAADLGRAYTKAPPAPVAFSWTGFYAGVHGGYGWSDPTATFDPGALATGTVPGYVVTGGTGPFTLDVSPKGGFGGGQIGYNWQSGAFVYGLEADVSGAAIRETASRPFSVTGTIGGDNGAFTGVFNLKQEIDVFGTVRGRIGYAANNLLIYGTGGFAWGHVKNSIFISNLATPNIANFNGFFPALTRSASSSEVQVGFSAGGGLEWAFDPRWTFKAEYIYINLGKSNGNALAFPGASFTDTEVQLHTAKGGINYRF